ncbi:MAG TPA: DUF4229 domain-containing protein [Mycobacteriales bacterium]|nr:DUF4229 domain-containing protein [Mycobacteriales bacterium]
MAAGGEQPEPRVAEPSGARAVLIYNLLRLSLLVACLVAGWYAGIHNWLYLCAGAFLVSGVISWFALKHQRIAMGMAIERTVERGRTKMAERTATEDAYADQVNGAAGPQPNDN